MTIRRPARKRVVVTDHAFPDACREEEVARSGDADFSLNQCRTEEDTLAAVAGAHVVFNNFAPLTRRVQESLAPSAVVIRYGVGVDNVDLAAARDLGIRVCNVPDYGVEEVADHAAAMALFLSRRIGAFDGGVRQESWTIAEMAPNLRSLRDTTVGLVGFGRIAQALARRVHAFGARVVAYDPYVPAPVWEQAGVERLFLDDVLREAHILSLHVPLLPETRHIVDWRALERLPVGAIVVNVSRGGLIDEAALAEALVSGRLAGAGLDVFETEPLPGGSPLRKAPNLLLSPHAAFYSKASVATLQRLASEEAKRALRGEPLRCALT